MCEHDRHMGEVDGDIVDWHWVAVLEPNASAATHAGADAAVAGVEQHWQACFGKDLVERVSMSIVGPELLNRWMQFETSDLAGGDKPLRLANRFRATRRIDADKRQGD